MSERERERERERESDIQSERERGGGGIQPAYLLEEICAMMNCECFCHDTVHVMTLEPSAIGLIANATCSGESISTRSRVSCAQFALFLERGHIGETFRYFVCDFSSEFT